MVQSLHAEGIKVMPWTVNRPPQWERLRELGCDGIITDFPAEAVEWRNGSRTVVQS
jgi:glycerophosphoryl diester phosphodiesterase